MKKEIIIAAITTIIYLTIGIILLLNDIVEYGLIYFLLLPFITGFVVRARATSLKYSFLGMSIGSAAFVLFLLISNYEGFVCLAMASPLVLLGFIFGWVFKSLQKIRAQNKALQEKHNINALVSPMLIFILLGIGEKQLIQNHQTINSISSTIELPYSSMEVYNAIKHVDTLDAEKPFLMRLDLPIPQKCVLEAEEIGALRTCYFEGGQIIERITELEPGVVLKMDVIDYQLTGRDWLGFKEAIYHFETLPNGNCIMTRITTYTSELHPRIYWKPLEKIGIQQEHEYVFRNLEKDLNIKHNQN